MATAAVSEAELAGRGRGRSRGLLAAFFVGAGINHSRVVSVAIYCRLTPECKGTATLMLGGKHQGVGHAGFALRGNKTSHLPIRVAPQVVKMIRAHHGIATTLVAVVAGKTVTQTINVKIF